MLQNKAQLECKIGDRVFHFLCGQDSPIHEVRDALAQFLGFVANVDANIKAQKEAEDKSKEQENPAAPVAEPAKE